MKKRILALALSTAMILSAAPLSVLAADTSPINTANGTTTITAIDKKVIILRKSNSQVADWDEQKNVLTTTNQDGTTTWSVGPQGPQWYYGARHKTNHTFKQFEMNDWTPANTNTGGGWWAGINVGSTATGTGRYTSATFGDVAAERGILSVGGGEGYNYDRPYMEYHVPVSGTIRIGFEGFTDKTGLDYTGFPVVRSELSDGSPNGNVSFKLYVDHVKSSGDTSHWGENSTNNTISNTGGTEETVTVGNSTYKVFTPLWGNENAIPENLKRIDVKAGDKIRFSVGDAGSTGTDKQVALNPVIVYTAVSPTLGNITINGTGVTEDVVTEKVILGDLPGNTPGTVTVDKNVTLEVAADGLKPADDKVTVGDVGVTLTDGTDKFPTGTILKQDHGDKLTIKNNSDTQTPLNVGIDPAPVGGLEISKGVTISSPTPSLTIDAGNGKTITIGTPIEGPANIFPNPNGSGFIVTIGDDEGSAGKTGDITAPEGSTVTVKDGSTTGDITIDGNGTVDVKEGGTTGTIKVGPEGNQVVVEGELDENGNKVVTGPVIVTNDGTNGNVTVGTEGEPTKPGKTGDITIDGNGNVTVNPESTTGDITVGGDGKVDVKDTAETGTVTVGTKPNQTVVEKPDENTPNEGPFVVDNTTGAGEKKPVVTVGDGGVTGDITTPEGGKIDAQEGSTTGSATVGDTSLTPPEGDSNQGPYTVEDDKVDLKPKTGEGENNNVPGGTTITVGGVDVEIQDQPPVTRPITVEEKPKTDPPEGGSTITVTTGEGEGTVVAEKDEDGNVTILPGDGQGAGGEGVGYVVEEQKVDGKRVPNKIQGITVTLNETKKTASVAKEEGKEIPATITADSLFVLALYNEDTLIASYHDVTLDEINKDAGYTTNSPVEGATRATLYVLDNTDTTKYGYINHGDSDYKAN